MVAVPFGPQPSPRLPTSCVSVVEQVVHAADVSRDQGGQLTALDLGQAVPVDQGAQSAAVHGRIAAIVHSHETVGGVGQVPQS